MNIEKEIIKIYRDINLSKKTIKEAVDNYDNINFKKIGQGNPASDNINTALLTDIQTAAKNAGVNVDITTAVSGHDEKTTSGNTSRHPSGNAVDIAIINNRPVSPSIKFIVDKFVDELVKLGYVKNVESGNPKSVLTFGVKNHDNHVHVSNTTKEPYQGTDTNDYVNINKPEIDKDYASINRPEINKDYAKVTRKVNENIERIKNMF